MYCYIANLLNIIVLAFIFLGNEGKGISENILKLCDTLISIKSGQELPKGIDSLNVSVAAGNNIFHIFFKLLQIRDHTIKKYIKIFPLNYCNLQYLSK